jgi:hypothetical protein
MTLRAGLGDLEYENRLIARRKLEAERNSSLTEAEAMVVAAGMILQSHIHNQMLQANEA